MDSIDTIAGMASAIRAGTLTPTKIAESVSRTGFEARVKAEEKKGAGPTSHGPRPLVPRAPRG
jgi:hypothetical protein